MCTVEIAPGRFILDYFFVQVDLTHAFQAYSTAAQKKARVLLF